MLINRESDIMQSEINIDLCVPNYIFLSNLTHVSLWSLLILEQENINERNFIFLYNTYELNNIIERKNNLVKIYKLN